MPTQMTDADWDLLAARVVRGACTPFLGAGINQGHIPLPGDIALRWSEDGGYPLEDRWNFARVAQFMALDRGSKWPRDELAVALREARPGDVEEKDDVLVALAELPFRTYVTTTTDELLVRALRNRRTKRPRVDFVRWHEALRTSSLASVFEEDPHYVPTVDEPLVFHLHGQIAVAESLVLTEDDHFDLLVATARHPTLIPPPVQRALRGGALLFIGHPLADWNFRVLVRSLCGSNFGDLQAGSISVHVAPPGDDNKDVVQYFDKYFDKLQIRIFWGTPQEFLHTLRERCAALQTSANAPAATKSKPGAGDDNAA
jgi:hypothetical protein